MAIVTFPYSGESAHDLMHSGAGRFAVSVIDADAQFRRAARYAPAAGGLATLELDSVERYDAPSADKRLGCIVVEPRLDDWQQLQVRPSGVSSSEHLPLLLVAAEATATATTLSSRSNPGFRFPLQADRRRRIYRRRQSCN